MLLHADGARSMLSIRSDRSSLTTASLRARGTSETRHCGQRGHSHLSFALASALVCHCMFAGVSGPPRFSGMIWSRVWPGHPLGCPVSRSNSRFALSLRAMRSWLSRAQAVQ
jgi:hypothetical protein